MSEDKTAGPSGQAPNQASIDFLDLFIPSSKERLFLAGSIPGSTTVRKVGYYSDERMLALPDNERHHVTAATYPAGLAERDEDLALSVPFIILDDIGKIVPEIEGATPISQGIQVDEDVFMFLPEPTWKMETSAGRFQYGYHFTPSLTLVMARRIHAALKRHPVLGKGLHSVGGYFRLPTGTNTKPGRGAFRTRLAELGPSYSIQAFCDGFALDLTAVSVKEERSIEGATGRETLSADGVMALLDLIPNDLPDPDDKSRTGVKYDLWDRIGHAAWGATDGSDEGLEAFSKWSARSNKCDIDQSTAKTWDSYTRGPKVKASASTLRKIIEELYGPHSKERQKAEKIFADDMFDEVDETKLTDGADAVTAAEEKASQDFMALVHEARRLTKIPARFRRESDDDNWTPDDAFDDAFELANKVQPASPTIFAPFDRGVVSVRTGAPFAGKSLLMLNQAAAFCCERPDLLGVGYGPDAIQFAGDVLYFCNEDSRSVAVRRLQAWRKQHNEPEAKHRLILVRSNLLSRKDVRKPPVVECVRIIRIAVEHLRAGRSLPLMVFDTVRASVQGMNENSPEDSGEITTLLKWIAWGFWSAVVFVHHGTKAVWNDAEPKLGSAISGSGNFGGAVRGADNVRAVSDKEKIEKGLGGQKVIACQTIKASDDEMSWERFYAIETLTVEAEHAEREGVLVVKGMPVTVPLQVVATAAFKDESEQQWCIERLKDALTKGPVWRYVRKPQKGPKSGQAVHEVWNMEVKKAADIVDMMVAAGLVKVEKKNMGQHEMRDQVSLGDVAF
jgi:AAA domain/Primase C terminal 2 (PriCT-2)